MRTYTKHVLGEYDKLRKVQMCIMCGEIIHDYNEVIYKPDENGNIPVERGWVSGDHYISDGIPIYIMSSPPTNPNVKIVNCNNKSDV